MKRFRRKVLAAEILCLAFCAAAYAQTAVQNHAQSKAAARKPLLTCEERSFALDSFSNCRDFGGLPVRGGYIKRGMLFRTPRLSNATRGDVGKIRDLQWRTVIDLRGNEEISREGRDRLPRTWWFGKPLCKTINLPMYMRNQESSMYRTYLLDNPASVAGFFGVLADSEAYPVDFHCSAGKDRTGIMAALLLEYLGTPRDIIFEDFLFSCQRGMEVNRRDLEEVFAILDKEYHGIGNYLASQGADKEKLRRIPIILTDTGIDKNKKNKRQ